MDVINRSSLIVRPKAAYIEWARSIDEESSRFTAEDFQRERTVYLVEDLDDDRHAERLVRVIYDFLFETELEGWCTDESTWPPDRNYKMFREWFELEINTLVVDLVYGPIESEDL